MRVVDRREVRPNVDEPICVYLRKKNAAHGNEEDPIEICDKDKRVDEE